MKRAEAEKLLGGYATGTLSEAERRLLYEAALADQELFDALADEEALRELLAEPEARKRLLEALAEAEPGVWERLAAWWRRPVAWGVAGSVAVAAALVVILLPVYQTMTRKPVLQEVAAPVVRTAPAGRHAAEGPQEQPRAAAPIEPPRPAVAAPAVEQVVAERAVEKREMEIGRASCRERV